MKKIKVYYWSPFIDKVATTKAVLNSVFSLNKYSKQKFEAIIIDVFGEWLINSLNSNQYLKFHKLNNFYFLNKFSSHGFIKSRLKYLLIFFLSYFPLKNFIKSRKPDFLVIHLITSLPLFMNLINNFDTKIILRISGKPKLNFLRYLFWSFALKKIYRVTFPTLETLNYFKNLNIIDEDKLELLYDPIVHTRYLGKIKDEKFSEPGEFYLAIGRFTRQKNFLFLIKCFELLCKKDQNIKLIILGDGEHRKDFQKYIRQKNLEKNIILPGYEKNVHKYLSNCKLFILSSLWEDPGFVLVEAMFSEALVLSSDCSSGPKEILSTNEKRGILFESDNMEDFTKKFNEIKKFEDSKIKKMKLNAKIFTKNYTLFYHYNSLIKILNKKDPWKKN
tara:strand:- start:7273 stop:8439 length:1167 start_codon:yes stop_codon:yes gene_type:complete